jgi:hypothetical protein
MRIAPGSETRSFDFPHNAKTPLFIRNDPLHMANRLYTVKRSDGSSRAFLLSSGSTLTEIRKQLTVKQFMNQQELFLLESSPVERTEEAGMILSGLVTSGTTIHISATVAVLS